MGLVPGHPEGLGLVLGRVSLEQHSNLSTVGSLDDKAGAQWAD
jgi:hypothetical protein